MAKTFIVGGAGKIGSRLIPQLAHRGHAPLAMHRKPEQADKLGELGATPVPGDITVLSVAEIAELMRGSDIVVFTAGAGGAGIEFTNAIDGKGLEKCVDAARMAGVRRFLLISAFPDAERDVEAARRERFENYIHVKRMADAYLVATDLDWVIVRAGLLNNEPGRGRVAADVAIPYGTVPRDDVAEFVAELVGKPKVVRRIIELTEGDRPIPEAVDRLAY